MKNLEELVREIAEKHNQILDDFTKAYLVQRFGSGPYDLTRVKLIHQEKDGVNQWFFKPLTKEDVQSLDSNKFQETRALFELLEKTLKELKEQTLTI